MSSTQTFSLNLGSTMGAMLIGVVLSAMFQGITTMQTIFYYTTYPKDPIHLKLLVALLWTLDMLSLSIIAYGLYTYLVLDFLDVFDLLRINWGFATEPIVSGTIALIVHLFLAHRLWRLNKKWTPVALLIVVASVFPYVLVFIAAREALGSDRMWSEVSANLHWISIASVTSTSVIDLVITCAICVQLYYSKTGLPQTNRMLYVITLYTITSGLVPTIVCFGDLIAYVAAPDTLAFEVFQVIISRAYVNTLMATLNSRNAIRGRGAASELAAVSVPSVAFRRNTSSGNRSATLSMTGDADVEICAIKQNDEISAQTFSWNAE
ncbi:uncharacterized protein B0H18DRAFT_1003213 [Fomitopsis serialis]|uniref:uncharacterized protein n=1 Tax=Fomitopsis serialis TaxID=139415 RepID=UPI0020073807|nr:uncharacterized protein B0H18DRAFT_1003213 [Neoantrodia serialis]KAH9927672.1 hypothetical protein B0H18DRAFT_1003213 [Neoantrodia serialis]